MSDTTAKAQIGDFALLRVVSIESVGAFLDWGSDKDLFLPFREQSFSIEPGEKVLVYIYLDKSERPTASMRIEKFLSPDTSAYKVEDKADLLIFDETPLGYKAVINSKHLGMLYKNEVFQDLRYGDRIRGYIKKIREDGKIDLQLQAFGNKGSDDIGEKILSLLKENNGYLAITDKTDPEKIYNLFGVSKKKFKMALGGIYKKKLIVVKDDGIYLND